MGLLDGILNQVAGGQQAGNTNSLANVVMGMLGNQKHGGIDGLLGMLTRNGLGNQVQSWISTGQNQPVTADQISSALGPDQIARIAREAGIEPHHASSGLASMLPGLIDKLTPNGSLPEQSDLASSLSNLSKMFN